MESKYGCRYSILLDLPYFDPIRMTIIDLMHNLYLGTAKHILKDIWIEQGLIDAKSMSITHSRIDTVHAPRYVGRIPQKIASSFSGFTADQFKNWTNIYSIMALHDILSTEHIRCWQYFVQGSRILCQMAITDAQLELADAFLLQFCCKVENLYGKKVITPNMHLHFHLKESMYDYGPIHNFWLFSFERYNENFPSNSRSIEIQLMQKFVQESALYTSCQYLPEEFASDFSDIFSSHTEPALQGSLHATIQGSFISDLILVSLRIGL